MTKKKEQPPIQSLSNLLGDMFDHLVANQKPLDPDLAKLVDDNFWELLDTSSGSSNQEDEQAVKNEDDFTESDAENWYPFEGIDEDCTPVSSGIQNISNMENLGFDKDIWQEFQEILKEVEVEFNDLPEDLSLEHDHYLYGTPKKYSKN